MLHRNTRYTQIGKRNITDTTTTEPSLLTFNGRWRQLVTLEKSPTQWNLFISVVAFEDLYQRWGWNKVAATIVRHKLAPSEAFMIRDALELPPPQAGC